MPESRPVRIRIRTQTHKKKEEKKEPAAVAAPGVSPPDSVRITEEILEELTGAFRAYGKEIQTWSDGRRRALRARAKDHGGDAAVLVRAVHGYAAYHRGNSSDTFDPAQHLTPETIFRPSNFPKYLDAFALAACAGESPPFKLGKAPGGAEEATRREYLEFGSNAWEKAHGYKQ